MTATSSYPKISNNASKSQEKAALEAFMSSLGDQTYLHSLVSPKLVEWFFFRVDGDLNCDFFEQTSYTENELRRELGSFKGQLQHAEKVIEDQVQQMAAWQEDFSRDKSILHERISTWKANYEDECRISASIREQRDAEREQVKLLLDKAEAQQAEIVNLKAELYDLMTSGK